MILGEVLEGPRDVYCYLDPEETAMASPDRGKMLRVKRMDDPWDGRISKETHNVNLIKSRFPAVSVKDLTPILHEMRWVKDEKEIALLRACGRIGALGFNEAMKVTRPGLYEYQMAAACDFYYQYSGQQNPAFFAIAASGERALDWHYNANNHPMVSGDVVLLDYAPDLAYYVTDITRTWPVNGKFSEDQLKMYACVVDYRERAIAALKPGVTYDDLLTIGKETYEEHGYGALFPHYAGHLIGMAVHDVGDRKRAMVPGVVFNLEPIIEDKEKKVHFRLEDTIVITENGAEVLTGLTPVEPSAIEALIAERGIFE
jgi:Xaa-Pro aminopeptidase